MLSDLPSYTLDAIWVVPLVAIVAVLYISHLQREARKRRALRFLYERALTLSISIRSKVLSCTHDTLRASFKRILDRYVVAVVLGPGGDSSALNVVSVSLEVTENDWQGVLRGVVFVSGDVSITGVPVTGRGCRGLCDAVIDLIIKHAPGPANEELVEKCG
jgi:hypothetical protein